MSAKTNNVRIGIFVLVAIFIFIAGILAFGAKSYFAEKSTFETAIEGEVYGLSIGSKVELRGVPVGEVSKIAFSINEYPESKTDMIIVEFQIEGHIFTSIKTEKEGHMYLEDQIKKGLRASIKSQGVTGTSLLALEYLDPVRNPPPYIDYKPHHSYIPSAPGAFTRILESIENSLRHLQELDVVGIGRGVSNVLASTSQLTEKLNKVDMEAIGTNVNELVIELKSTVAEVGETLKGMKLDKLGNNADQLVVGLKETNTKLQVVLDHVGAVPMQQTVGDLQTVLETLNGVLTELKAYPSGFIFGQPPAPARSVESPSK